jgi:hypothetical protein
MPTQFAVVWIIAFESLARAKDRFRQLFARIFIVRMVRFAAIVSLLLILVVSFCSFTSWYVQICFANFWRQRRSEHHLAAVAVQVLLFQTLYFNGKYSNKSSSSELLAVFRAWSSLLRHFEEAKLPAACGGLKPRVVAVQAPARRRTSASVSTVLSMSSRCWSLLFCVPVYYKMLIVDAVIDTFVSWIWPMVKIKIKNNCCCFSVDCEFSSPQDLSVPLLMLLCFCSDGQRAEHFVQEAEQHPLVWWKRCLQVGVPNRREPHRFDVSAGHASRPLLGFVTSVMQVPASNHLGLRAILPGAAAFGKPLRAVLAAPWLIQAVAVVAGHRPGLLVNLC